MTARIIEFKNKAAYPGSAPQPRFVIEIYDLPDGGFDWDVLADNEISEDELSDYLGDMFFTLNPDAAEEPGIFTRILAFINRTADWLVAIGRPSYLKIGDDK